MLDINKAKDQHNEVVKDIYSNMESLKSIDIDILDKKMDFYSKEDWDPEIERPDRSIVQNIIHGADYALQGAVGIAKLIGKGSQIGYKLFKRGYEEARARLDKTGAKDLERTEKLLAATKGDGSGTFVDKELAIRLSIGGEKPDGIDNAISELVETTRHVQSGLIHNAIGLGEDLKKIDIKVSDQRSYGQWAVRIADRMKKIPLWNQLMGNDGGREWPGGYLMEKEVDAIEGESEIAKYFSRCDKDIDLKKTHKGYTAEGTLDVLTRDECLKIFKQVSNLINTTMDLGDKTDNKIDCKSMALAIKASQQAIEEQGIKVNKDDEERIKDATEVLMKYDYLNYSVVIDRLMNANTDYIAAVLKYCRKSIHHFEE